MREGESFAAAMAGRGVFPDVAVKMAEVGEATGALQDMLNSLADFYDEEIETDLGRFVTLVEPVAAGHHGDRDRRPAAGAVHAAVPADRRWSERRWATGRGRRRVEGTRVEPKVPGIGRPAARRRTPACRRCTPTGAEAAAADRAEEAAQARRLAERYGLEFVDLEQFQIDHDLFRSIPADLMLRYGFVPYRRDGRSLVIVVSDPTDLPMIDELARAAGHAAQGDGRRAVGDRVDPQEERELAARARGGDRGLPAPAAARTRRTATRT